MIACHRSDSHKTSILTTVTKCEETRKVRLGVAGGYGINGAGLYGEKDTLPYIYLDPIFDAGTPRTVPPTKMFELARYPAVSAKPRELCTAEVVSGRTTVQCIDGTGVAVPVALKLDEVASRLGISLHCLEVENEIGLRNLNRITQEWKTTLADCSETPKSRSTEVILEMLHPPRSAGCEVNDHPLCAQVRLSIPSIGFKRDLGLIWNFPLCSIGYLRNPAGIQVACSDNSLSYAEVYHYQNTVFYRIGETDEQRNGSGPAMQNIVLPSRAKPVFRFRSFVPIKSESSN